MTIAKRLATLHTLAGRCRPAGRGEMRLALTLKTLMTNQGLWPLVYDLGNMHVYDHDKGIWIELERDIIRSIVLQFDGRVPIGGRNPIRVNAHMSKGIYECLRLDKEVYSPGFFSSTKEGIPFQNCMVTLKDGEFVQENHSPDNRLRAVFPFDYQGGRVSGRFSNLLADVFSPDDDNTLKVEALQEYVGAAMAGVATHYQRSLVVTGGGSNGKNTVFDVLSGLFPPEFVTSISPQQWSDQYYRAQLHNSLLNLVPDMQDTRILSNSDFKPIVSGDPVMASHKHKDPFEFRCRASHVFICNELPTVLDFSYGYRRRFLILEFNRQFKQGETGTRTKEEIVQDVLQERSAIGAWALEGYARLTKNGAYTEPPSHNKAMNRWLSQSDPVADYISSACERVEEEQERWEDGEELFVDFRTWAKKQGHRKAFSMRDFVRRLEQLGMNDNAGRWPIERVEEEIRCLGE